VVVKPLAVHHVSINVTDVDEAMRFYVDKLGLAPRTDRPQLGIGGAWLDAGGQQLHLIQAETPRPLGQHFALLVRDLIETIEELRAEGVAVSDPSPVGPNRQAFLNDPAGNMVELHQRGRSKELGGRDAHHGSA
jgi:catechol 2,3-dioxygenase-like lactoylglutathione lyase family enzyme